MKFIKLLTYSLLILSTVSCRKEEFMPEADGEKIPHVAVTSTMKERLAASPYTIFKAAWSRSDMEQILKEKGVKLPYSLLVPTDAAFIADGLTLEVINNTTPALLDSLLLYHTLEGNLIAEDLQQNTERYIGKSLLDNPYLKVRSTIPGLGAVVYSYLQYMKVTAGELFINGKKAGKITPIQAQNGLLQPIDRVLHKPTKTIMEVLQEDGRFGMYIEANRLADELYMMLSEYAFPHDFTNGLTYYQGNYNILFTSIFAIPDQVFKDAGFETVEEIMALNDRNPLPYLNWEDFSMVGGLATDTLLQYHRWGTVLSVSLPNYGRGQDAFNNFYSNDLTNANLSNYTLVTSGLNESVPVYINPLDFNSEAGVVKVKVKGSDYPAATIVESDLNTLMGPVHVVDRLILPKGFKL